MALVPSTSVGGGSASDLASGKVVLTSGNITTGSTTFVALTGATVTIATGAHRVLLVATVEGITTTGGAGVYLDLTVDGTRQGGTNGLHYVTQVGTNDMPLSIGYVTDVLTAASHTFAIQWRVSAGTGTIYAAAANPVTLAAVELLAV